MPKIAFLGAGSTIFARNLLSDLLSFPEFAEITIALHDIDARRLATTTQVARNLARQMGAAPVIESCLDRRSALEGADYAINMIQVGGYKPGTVIDFEIPKRYGLRQTIGDTLGIGGIMRALRTIPVLLAMGREMEAVCPDVLHLSYVNPMAMNTWAMLRGSSVRTVGLCHSVPDTARALAADLGLPPQEVSYLAAGINHMAFFLKLERDGVDLYPQLRQVIEAGRVPPWNRVRYEVFNRLGYFVTESSEHFSEYVPWFIKRHRPDLIERYNIPLDEYLHRCEAQAIAWEFAEQAEAGRPPSHNLRESLAVAPTTPGFNDGLARTFERLDAPTLSGEFAPLIIHSLETGAPRTIYANLLNTGWIDNLPECVVEVPCQVDGSGLHPTRIGSLPLHLAALIQTNLNVQALTVEAALTGRRESIYHAAMLDPRTAAELDLEQIWCLVDDLIAAHGDSLAQFQNSQP